MKSKQSFNGYIAAVAVVVIFVFLNLIVEALANKVQLRFDCTENKIFNLSQQTTEYLKTVDEDVTIYYLTEGDYEYPYVLQTVDRYIKANSKLSLEYVDIIKNPMAVSRYTQNGQSLAKGDIVVESSKRFKIVDTGAALKIIKDGNVTNSLGFILEEKLTNAIDFVLADKNLTVSYVTGHNGASFSLPADKLGDENIEVTKVDLQKDEINADLLAIFGLREDLTIEEYNKVTNYLASGGKCFVAFDPGVKTPNIEKIAEDYGIIVNDDAVIEDDPNKIIKGNRLYLLTKPVGSAVKDLQGKGNLLFPVTGSLMHKVVDDIQIEVLAQTLDTARRRRLVEGELGEETGRGTTDIALLAVKPTDSSAIFVTATTQFIEPADTAIRNIVSSFDYVNREFFVQIIKSVCGGDGISISIAPKSIMSRSLHLSRTAKTALTTVFLIIPIAVLLYGLVIWQRRRNL